MILQTTRKSSIKLLSSTETKTHFKGFEVLEVTVTITININRIVFQRLGQPIQDRHREHEDRPRAFEELGKKLQFYMKFVDSYKQKVNHFYLVIQCFLIQK